MSSSCSRKRRHKSKDKTLAVNLSSDEPRDSKLSQTSEQKAKQQESEQPRLQQDSVQSTAHQESEQPDRRPVGKQQGNRSDQQLVASTPVPPLTSLLDRFFFSRHSDVSSLGNVNLQGAVSWRHHDIVETLLQKGEDLAELYGSKISTFIVASVILHLGSADTRSVQNSLMVAASNGDVKMLNVLWAFKGNVLDINATDKDGNTALHLCTQTSCKEGVSFLMSCGADVTVKNKRGQTPLHIAAKQGDPDVCDAFIKSLTQGQSTESEQQATVKGILKEDLAGRTPICEALRFQHLMVVKTLMNSCDQDEALDFYLRRIEKLKNLPTGGASDSDQDIQAIMGSLLLVIKRLQKDHLKELADADPINCLVEVIRLHVESIRVLSTACLMISQLIWKECTDEGDDLMKVQGQEDDARNRDVRDELLKQFLDCRGPHMVMEKLSSHVFTAHDTYLIVSTLLPVMILASRAAGKIWLEQNSGNLSFFKELLTRKKTFITHINLRNQIGHGLQLGHLIKEFSSFVEGIEAKDREQNLVELLEEEERERIKREKKKRKRQKKQNKQTKVETTQVTITEASTDDDIANPAVAWNSEAYRKCSDISTSRSLENNPARSLFNPQQEAQAIISLRNTHKKELEGATKKLFSSHSAETNSEKETKWTQSVTAAEEFPPISASSDDRVTTDSGEGWVKVEGRKPGGRNAIKPMSSCLVNPNPVKTQEFTKLAPMRWADVAKIGCSKDPGTRNFTVLLGDVGKSGSQDYFKLSSLSKTSETSTSVISQSSQSEENKRRGEERNSDWQQIARNAFVDNMSSKERDIDLAQPTDVSSDSDSEDICSTTSSECPSGLSSELKNSISMAEDFSGIDTSFSKTACKNREFPSIACAFSNFYSEPKEHKLFPSEDVGCFDFNSRSFIGQRILADSATVSDKNHHRNDEKLQEGGLSWNWLDEKFPASLLFQNSWETSSSANRSLDLSSQATCFERKHPFQRQDVAMDIRNMSLLPRLSSPPFSARDLFTDLLPEFGNTSSSQYQLQSNQESVHKTEKMSFEFPFQKKMFIDQQQTMEAWQSAQFLQSEVDRIQWVDKEAARVKPLTHGKFGAAWTSLVSGDGVTSSASTQQAPENFMPSFASMSNAVDNNPIVTSVVESVLTPTFTPLSSCCTETKLPTFCSSKNDVPSPPPGFQLHKPNPLRAFALDTSLSLLNTQSAFSKPTTVASATSELTGQDFGMSNISSPGGNGEFDARPVDKPVTYSTPRSRSPMVGVVGPFTKVTKASDESLTQQQLNRQHRQLAQTSIGNMFVPSSTAPSFSSVVSSCLPNSVPRSSLAQSVFGLPVNASQKIPVTTTITSWSERVAQSLNQTSTTSLLSSTASPTVSTLMDFSSILTGRPQVRSTSRLLDSQSSLLKRTADNQLRSLQDVMETYQRRQAEQLLLQQQLHERQLQQQCYGLTGSHLTQLYRQQKTGFGLQQQHRKSSTSPLLPQQRHNQHRVLQPQLSPPVLFPSDLRDESDTRVGDKQQTFPAFHDTGSSVLLSDLFADPLLIERIAINQIRQQFQTQQANCLLRESAMCALRDSVYANDLEYYASMYRVKLKDILGGSPWHGDTAADGISGTRSDKERHNMAAVRNSVNQDGRCMSPDRECGAEKPSRRWRDAINRILETPWTMRRQFGDIVLPGTLAEYTVSHVEFPLVLGLTTEGHEVAVLILDKSQAYIDPCLLEVMCDPDLDHHFILKCKGMSETCTTEYVAVELCDYTLSEYMQIVQLSHRQDPLSANRLSWQLLEGLKFVHHHLGIPHGFLKPNWIFVDSEGRLRLGGCGIVTKQSGHVMGTSAMDRNDSGRSACWASSEDLNNDHPQPSMASDIQVAGMLLYFILTGGQHPFGATPLEAELNIARNSSQMQHISEEANDLVSGMLFPDPSARPTIEHCLKHPFFWSSEKKFRLILIVGSDVLTEMKTGIALTGNGSPTMMEILGVLDISEVSPNWVQTINPTVMKEMRSFRVYKNSLSELTLFIYNCCLHFDKMSAVAKEVLDDPCKYFQSLFPSLFMAIYRSLKASDRIDRTCYKPFF